MRKRPVSSLRYATALFVAGALALTAFPHSASSARQQAPAGIIDTPWCGERWVAVDEDTCYFAPPRLTSPASVIFFVHGMLAPGAAPAHERAMLRAAAQELGAVVVFPRGQEGLCTWNAGFVDYLCWPTRRETVDAYAPGIAADWEEAETRVERALGVRFARRYVLGFSNGGYFASYLALEGWLPVDGVGVVGAGRSFVDERRLDESRPPVYVAVGAQEAPSTQKNAKNLARVLAKHEYPHRLVVHEGRGHAVEQDDLAEAWSLWRPTPNR